MVLKSAVNKCCRNQNYSTKRHPKNVWFNISKTLLDFCLSHAYLSGSRNARFFDSIYRTPSQKINNQI